MDKKKAQTRKDDLYTGAPFWVHTPHSTLKAQSKLTKDRYDIIVVGSGISGALVAEALSAEGKSVLIVDRRSPVRGSTVASTAMIQHEIDIPLTKLRKSIGKDKADRAWRRSVKAVGDLVRLSQSLQLDCQMVAKPALYLAGNEMGARALSNEANARQEIGIEARYLKQSDLAEGFGIDRPAAILSQDSASANPAQLTAGILSEVLKRKAALVSPVEITDMAELPSGIALATRAGEVLVADYAVFCTGYEYLPQMATTSHHVTSTWALASEPLKGLPDWLQKTILWEAADPYLYLRTDAFGRIIAGGEDEPSAQSNDDPKKLQRKAKVIRTKVLELTGIDIGRPAYIWAAPFSVTRDGLPIVDKVPGFERCFAVMGFGGNGITFSVIAAQIIAAMVTGKSDADADVFRFR